LCKEGDKSDEVKSYTGDVVQEYWCGTMFREHRYTVKEDYDVSMMAMQYSGRPQLRTYKYFETINIETTNLREEIPKEIKDGKWSDPSKLGFLERGKGSTI